MAHIALLGAGSWGTALAVLLCRNGHSVTLWSHRKEHADSMRKTGINEKSFPGIRLPETLTYTSDIEEAVSGRDLVLFVVPSTALRETAGKAATCLKREQLICCASKGIEEGTLLTQCGILEEILPDNSISVLSGPSHAEEVIDGLPTVVVAGSADRSAAERIQEIFMNRTFRVYTSPDVQGIEIGAALKNVIALAAGMSDGLGYGDNAKAALITRGIKEISALAVAMGGRQETLSGLAGTGDLIVTCSSRHSRNRRAGMLIGQGMSAKEAMAEVNMVVEGVYSTRSALALGEKYQVCLPIIEQVYEVIFCGKNVQQAVTELMERDPKAEVEAACW